MADEVQPQASTENDGPPAVDRGRIREEERLRFEVQQELKRKGQTREAVGCAVLLLLVLFSFLGSKCSGPGVNRTVVSTPGASGPNGPPTAAPSRVPLNAIALLQEYRRDASAANAAHMGKDLLVSGRVTDVMAGASGGKILSLSDGAGRDSVYCDAESADSVKFSGLPWGTPVVIEGIGDGLDAGVVVLRGCRATEIDGVSLAPIHVSAEELLRAYQANEIAADQKYRGRNLVVTGEVVSVGRFFDDIEVSLKGGDFFSNVDCLADLGEADKAAKLVKGMSISVSGVGSSIIGPALKDCRLP